MGGDEEDAPPLAPDRGEDPARLEPAAQPLVARALYVDIRGLTTRRLQAPNGDTFQIDFDFVDHRLVVRTDGGAVESFALEDGLSVADFDEKLHAALAGLGIDVAILEQPFGLFRRRPSFPLI
jgi:hypothetical protein